MFEGALIAPDAIGSRDRLVRLMPCSAKRILTKIGILISVGLWNPLLLGHHELFIGGHSRRTGQEVLLDLDCILVPINHWVSIV